MAVTAAPASLADPPPRELARRILALAAPTSVLAALQVVAQLVDTWLAARQGTAALAGWAVLLPLSLLLQQTSAGAMGGGVVSAVARALGAKRLDDASALVRHALLIAVAAGLVFALGVGLGARAILGAVAGLASADAATAYGVWLFGVGAVPVWLTNTLGSVLRGGGRHDLAARVLTVTWTAIPALSWLLAEPLGLGLAGLGIALAGVSWCAAAVMAVVVLRGGAGFPTRLRGPVSAALFRRILAVGAVASMLALIANLTTLLVTAQLRHHGTAAVAAYGIAARLEFLVVPIAFSVGSALTALVGRSVGAGDWATARRTAWLGGAMAFLAAGGLGVGVALFAPVLTPLATQDPDVAAIAARGLGYTGFAFGGFGLGMALYFASMGAGRMAFPIAAALSRITLAVAGGAWLAEHTALGVDGHFLGVALGIACYGLVTAAGVRPGVWQPRP
jgi:Na+-driven multidrug efflux pump